MLHCKILNLHGFNPDFNRQAPVPSLIYSHVQSISVRIWKTRQNDVVARTKQGRVFPPFVFVYLCTVFKCIVGEKIKFKLFSLRHIMCKSLLGFLIIIKE